MDDVRFDFEIVKFNLKSVEFALKRYIDAFDVQLSMDLGIFDVVIDEQILQRSQQCYLQVFIVGYASALSPSPEPQTWVTKPNKNRKTET